ncbi:MAG: outer membrane beta-barrel protein [Bacteroidota bacterium]
MRKIVIVMFVLAMFCFSNSYGQVRAGIGFVWGSEIEDLGINFNGEYNFDEYWSAETQLSIFFVEDEDSFFGEVDRGFWTLNFDGHYHFQGNSSGPYALAGINIATFSVESASDTNVGLNLGGGYLYEFDGPISAFGDVKYVISDFDQLVIRLGAKYTF